MTRTLALTVTLVLLGFAGLQPAYVTSGQADWKTILDGTTLKGWDVVGNANWSVADGAVQASRAPVSSSRRCPTPTSRSPRTSG